MPLKTILVSLNVVERASEVLSVASDLAANHGAHLIGLFTVPGVQYYSVPAGAHAAIDINEEQRNYYLSKAKSVEKQFEDTARKAGIKSEWRFVKSEYHLVAGIVIEHGRQADLIVVSQATDEGFDSLEAELGERLVMESGRPVLIVPNSGSPAPVATNAVIGWNGTGEAARAAMDAIPLLKKADRVAVSWVNSQTETGGDLPGCELATALARHGINASAEPVSSCDTDISDILLTKVSDFGADLLVVGSYGHSRLREFIFGGVTRNLLDNTTVPILMSH